MFRFTLTPRLKGFQPAGSCSAMEGSGSDLSGSLSPLRVRNIKPAGYVSPGLQPGGAWRPKPLHAHSFISCCEWDSLSHLQDRAGDRGIWAESHAYEMGWTVSSEKRHCCSFAQTTSGTFFTWIFKRFCWHVPHKDKRNLLVHFGALMNNDQRRA